MLKLFENIGVSKLQIEKRIQRRIDSIQPAQMVLLRKIYKSISDGMANVGEFFDAEQAPESEKPKSGIKGLKSKIAEASQENGE